jgi:hypothetical protein
VYRSLGASPSSLNASHTYAYLAPLIDILRADEIVPRLKRSASEEVDVKRENDRNHPIVIDDDGVDAVKVRLYLCIDLQFLTSISILGSL